MPPKKRENKPLQNQMVYLFLLLLIIFVVLTGFIIFKNPNNLEKMKTMMENMFCVNIKNMCIPIGLFVALPLLILLNYYINNPTITFMGTMIICLLFVLLFAPLPQL